MKRYNRTTAPRSHEIEQCVGCGYPFDPGEPCLETTAEELVCGAACADYMERVYRERFAEMREMWPEDDWIVDEGGAP